MIYLSIKTTTHLAVAATHDPVADHWDHWTHTDFDALAASLSKANEPILTWNVDRLDLVANLESARIHDLAAPIHRDTGRRPTLTMMAEANLIFHSLAADQRIARWLKSGDPLSIACAQAACQEETRVLAILHARLLRGEALRIPPNRAKKELGELVWRLRDQGE